MSRRTVIWGRIARLSLTRWRRIALGTVFLVIGSAAGLLYPLAIRDIINEAMESVDPTRIDRAAIIMGVLFAIQGFAIAFRQYLFGTAGERIVADLRSMLFRQIIEREVAFFDVRKTGELVGRLAADTGVLQNAVSVNVSMLLRHGLGVLGGVALLMYTSPRLTMVMLTVVPAVALGAVYFGRKIRVLSRRSQDALASASEVAEETISLVRTVKAFNREDAEVKRYERSVDESFEMARQRALAMGLFSGMASFAGYGAIAVVLWYGGRLVTQDLLTVGALTSFILYTLIVAFSLASLGALVTDFLRAAGAAERIFELLDDTTMMPRGEGARPEGPVRGAIALQDVHFRYPSRPDVEVLRGLSLRLEPGTSVALVGASGGGKSTVASLLCRLYDVDDGEILLDGHPLATLDPVWIREHVAIVEQEPVLLSTSIAENIRYGKWTATDEEVETAARDANALSFIEAFPEGLATRVGERGVQLSGGQKQRIAIARALLKDPRLLILDEATSALDAESEFLVQEALDRLMRGRTTLVIAHRLSTVRGADTVVVIDAGRAIQEGTHAELILADGPYRRLVERQFSDNNTRDALEDPTPAVA